MTSYDTAPAVYRRTNIVVDGRLVKRGTHLAKVKSRRNVVGLALCHFVARRKERTVLKLIGQDLSASDYDMRAVWQAMIRDPG